jgi:hypothetical protein
MECHTAVKRPARNALHSLPALIRHPRRKPAATIPQMPI